MKNVTVETLTRLADDILTKDIKNDPQYLSMVYSINSLDEKGETDVYSLLAAHNSLVLLNVVRVLEKVFYENGTEGERIRLLSIKKNASNFIYQMTSWGDTNTTYDQLLAHKLAKAAIDIIGRQYLLLIADYDIEKVPVDLLPGYIALNASVGFLKEQIDSTIETLDEWYREESVSNGFSLGECETGELPDEIGDEVDETSNLPDEIGDEVDETSNLPDEIGLHDENLNRTPDIPKQFKR